MKRSILAVLVVSGFAVLCLSSAPTGARADVVWLLHDVPLSDGGSINGSFSVNQYGFLDAFNVTTTAGSTLAGANYNPSLNANIVDGDQLVIFNNPSPAYDGALNLDFSHSLAQFGPNTLQGGNGGPSFECGSYETVAFGCPAGDSIRYVSRDFSVSGTPEPASWMAMILGLGFLGLGLRMRRKVPLAAA